ncbi:hypothetical protein LIER_13771 [Lithospermum erythrorhizon]|uniref:Uncharacterized protein n=1 Tax=Lithospermum erythrorhizon TaxID=34254 RepID=A0AAV3PYN0_LITER
MSSSNVNLSSHYCDSQGYARDTPGNQELVAESQTAIPAEIALQEGVTSACEAIPATKEGPSKKNNKRTLVKGANPPTSSEAAPGTKGYGCSSSQGMVPLEKADRPKFPPTDDTFPALEKLRQLFRHKLHWKIFYEERVLIRVGLIHDKEFDSSENLIPWGDILLAAKETTPPNTIPLASMRDKRPIAFKKVKVEKKVALSPLPSLTAELTPRPSLATNLTSHSSPSRPIQMPHTPPLLMWTCLTSLLPLLLQERGL